MLLCTVATAVFTCLSPVAHQAPSRSARRNKMRRQVWTEAKKQMREVWNSLILVWLVLGWLYYLDDFFHLTG
jgi:hypothetical protein